MSPPAGALVHKPAGASCLLILNLILVVGVAQAAGANSIGINYGTLGDNLPSAAQVVQLITTNKIGCAKIFDHNPTIISAFANSGVNLAIGVTNQEVIGIGQNSAAATQWVQQYVVPYFPATQIDAIVVGNELLTYSNPENVAISQYLPAAMRNLYSALNASGLHRNIKISTAVAYDALNISYPPSNGSFRSDVAETILRPILSFLHSTGSPFMINVYPYFAYASNPNVSVDYATFGVSAVPVIDGLYQYNNILDAQLDALYFAMARLGYGNISICITETGWPTQGDPGQLGASIPNAAHYNRRLVRRLLSGVGTPARPLQYVQAYLFALFNEDLKPGPTVERHWGLLYPNGSAVYPIDLTGQLADTGYQPLGGDTAAPPPTAGTGTPAPPPPQTSDSPPPPFSPPQNSPPAPTVPLVPPPPPTPEATLPPPPPPPYPPPPSAPLTPPTLLTAPPPPIPVSQGPLWCTTNPNATPAAIQLALDYACGQGQANCVPIQIGQPCFDPNTLNSHASWALNSYYQQTKALGGTCDFAGAATLTAVNPSLAGCIYPSN
eukprot:TRINITY_DN918_c0_g1_i1.p1 TRINITY_DN918_c0_g1~~TRINITY_DN918_c0_g1_i1.p1  ORF type:complete len:553 (+),score=38.84 TRINITY_DN918_c0_g1_i1:72-1730(+)